MDRTRLNYIVDLALAISFFASFTTGLIRFPGLLQFVGISYRWLPMLLIIVVHEWSGVAMGIFAGIHLALHWRWIVAVTKSIFRGELG